MNIRGWEPRLARSRLPRTRFASDWRERTRMNANRIAAGWGNYLANFEWEFAATLTFDSKRSGSPSEALVSRESFDWCNLVARLSRLPSGWAYAIEGGGGGSLHAHALIAGVRVEAIEAAEAAWRARNGRIKTTRVNNPTAAAGYLTKSIGPNGEVVFSDTLDRYRRDACVGESPKIEGR